MKTCPVCEGRKITGQLIQCDNDSYGKVPGAPREITILIDQPCGACKGKGMVGDICHTILTGGYSPCKDCHAEGCTSCGNIGYVQSVPSLRGKK